MYQNELTFYSTRQLDTASWYLKEAFPQIDMDIDTTRCQIVFKTDVVLTEKQKNRIRHVLRPLLLKIKEL